MSDLDFYSPYYHSAPDLHKSIGMMLFAVLLLRLVWRTANERPRDDELPLWERRLARAAHIAFYLLLFLLIASGYLISTADGRAVDVFGLVSIPAVVIDKLLEDPAALIHEVAAWAVVILALVHAGAALKHHFVDRKPTLRRMVRGV